MTQPAKTRKVILPSTEDLRLQIKTVVTAMEHGERLLAKAEIAYQHHADALGVRRSREVHNQLNDSLGGLLTWLKGMLLIASSLNGTGRHNALLDTLHEEQSNIQRLIEALAEKEKSLR